MSRPPWFADALDGNVTHEELRERAARNAELVASRQNGKQPAGEIPYITTREAIQEWIDEERRGPENDTSTGWPDIDALLGKPMRHSEVILIAARTGVGKTWAIQGILENTLEAKPESSALLIQLEMPAFHMAERLATHALNLAPGGARSKARYDLTVDQVMTASPLLERLGMVTRSLGVAEIPRAIDAMHQATGQRPDIVALDYLGLLKGQGRSRYEVASDVSQRLKAIANDEGVLLLAAAQLSREGGDGTKRPSLEMLRDSGVAEEASDRVLGLWRPQPIEDEDAPTVVDGLELGIVVLKNRFGPSGGEAKLQYDHTLRLTAVDDSGIPWA